MAKKYKTELIDDGGKLKCVACGDWIIWTRQNWARDDSGNWAINLRCMFTADRGAPGRGRRNYWIRWNGSEIAGGQDIDVIEGRYPGEPAILGAFLWEKMKAPE